MHMNHDQIHEKHTFINKLRNQTLNLLQFIINLVLCMCALFYSSFVCISAYANVYFKTTIIKQSIKIILIAGVSMSAYANDCFKTICEFMRQINIHRSEVHCGSAVESGGSSLPYYCTPPVCVPAVLGALAVWRLSKIKNRIPITWTWVWVRDGDEKMWRHIFVTKRYIPGSMWRCQVSNLFFKYFQKLTIFMKFGTTVTISSPRQIIFLGSAWNKPEFENLVRSWVLDSRFCNFGFERPLCVLQDIAWGYMRAHQHCDLFYPLAGDLIGSAINWVILQSSGPGKVLGS